MRVRCFPNSGAPLVAHQEACWVGGLTLPCLRPPNGSQPYHGVSQTDGGSSCQEPNDRQDLGGDRTVSSSAQRPALSVQGCWRSTGQEMVQGLHALHLRVHRNLAEGERAGENRPRPIDVGWSPGATRREAFCKSSFFSRVEICEVLSVLSYQTFRLE